MVLVIDLDEESVEADKRSHVLTLRPQPIGQAATQRETSALRPMQNTGSFSAALACYPIISQVARDLDLNSLDNLSRTCRLFNALLGLHRKSLIALAMRCSRNPRPARGKKSKEQDGDDENCADVITTYKRWPCAADLVGECRRCGSLVCRNCTAKALPPARLAKRHRRLCKTCLRAPLSMLMAPHLNTLFIGTAFTYPAFTRGPCECAQFFWLCQPCGHYFPACDTSYFRTWMWRISYSTYLGGLGTGIGEGYEGVKCGRGESCLAARKIEVEEDCGFENDISMRDAGFASPSSQPLPLPRHSSPEDHESDKAGYFRQEVEGLGGHMRGKKKRMVIVGQTVDEHEDERESGNYLSREAKGICRSWCSWCERVIPSVKETEQGLPCLRGAL